MVIAEARLDLGYGSLCLPDEAKNILAGRMSKYRPTRHPITMGHDQYVDIPVGGPMEVRLGVVAPKANI